MSYGELDHNSEPELDVTLCVCVCVCVRVNKVVN